jgi:hypothetical protein
MIIEVLTMGCYKTFFFLHCLNLKKVYMCIKLKRVEADFVPVLTQQNLDSHVCQFYILSNL